MQQVVVAESVRPGRFWIIGAAALPGGRGVACGKGDQFGRCSALHGGSLDSNGLIFRAGLRFGGVFGGVHRFVYHNFQNVEG